MRIKIAAAGWAIFKLENVAHINHYLNVKSPLSMQGLNKHFAFVPKLSFWFKPVSLLDCEKKVLG